MKVVRVEEGDRSRIEPPLDQSWPPFTQLEWHAAVVGADAGVPIRVYEVERGRYSLTVGRVGTGDYDFHHTWTYLNGVHTGASVAQRRDSSGEGS